MPLARSLLPLLASLGLLAACEVPVRTLVDGGPHPDTLTGDAGDDASVEDGSVGDLADDGSAGDLADLGGPDVGDLAVILDGGDLARSDASDGGARPDGGDGGARPDGGGNPDLAGCGVEVCNDGLDNNCDGQVDERCPCKGGQTARCYRGPAHTRGVGLCVDGTMRCVGDSEKGVWGPCTGDRLPSAELCDAARNDESCDGARNEGCICVTGVAIPCGSSVGLCRLGTQTCDAKGHWGPCVGGVAAAPEKCDGADNDCDGVIDNGCACVTGAMRGCGSSVGVCRPGTQTCSAAGQWGACAGGVAATTEVCNKLDDDCDGATDEGDVCPKLPPMVACPPAVTTTTGATVSLGGSGSDPNGGTPSFSWSVTRRPAGSTAEPSPPDAAATSFVPDVAGGYELRLCATNAIGLVACCTVTVTATAPCVLPDDPGLSTCGTSWDRRPILEFAPLPAGISYTVVMVGVATPLATVTAVGQNYFRPAAPVAAGGPPPGTPASFQVKACRVSDPACCKTSATVTTALVEACATPIAPTAQNLLFSEYLINGDGGACPGPDCESGEAIEITNLSHCPVALAGHHFSYCSPNCSSTRWMDFTSVDVIPPRGVYVAIRQRASTSCSFPFLGPDDPSLFGLRVSRLDMMGDGLPNGWFNNAGGGTSRLRLATGAFVSMTSGSTLATVSPYSGAAPECSSIGYDAVNRCGDVTATSASTTLTPNQLGRLWHPCDAVVSPVPAGCK